MENQNQQNSGRSSFIHEYQIPSGEIKPSHLAATTTQALGDLYYSDGSKFIRLPIGTANQVLTVVGGVPKWV